MTPSAPLEDLARGLQALKPAIEALVPKFRAAVAAGEGRYNHDSSEYPDSLWVLVAHTDSLVRVRLFLEQNFNYVEPMGLLAVTRYLFELLIWLKLMHADKRYG